jgi:predicted small metal-binding protein
LAVARKSLRVRPTDIGKERGRAMSIVPDSIPPIGPKWVNTMSCGMLKVECDDGFVVMEKDQKELVHHVQHHLEHRHGGKHMSEAEIMKMAKHP